MINISTLPLDSLTAGLPEREHEILHSPELEILAEEEKDAIASNRELFADVVNHSGNSGDTKFKTSLDLSDEKKLEALRLDMLGSYLAYESVQEARNELIQAVQARFSPERSQQLLPLIDQAIGLYLHPNQYHTPTHILRMATDTLKFSDKKYANLSDDDTETAFVVALYHDTGNSRHPDAIAGTDELAAAEIFLREVKTAPEGTYLATLSNDKILQVVGSILATVFRDRQADAEYLEHLLPEEKKIDYVGKGVELLKLAGIDIPKNELVKRMRNTAAFVSMNADVAASLGNAALANSLRNFQEDTQRNFAMYGGNDFAAYAKGFGGFLTGTYGPGEDRLKLREMAKKGFAFVDAGTTPETATPMQIRGKELFLKWQTTIAAYVQHDGVLLNMLFQMISRDNDPTNTNKANLLAMPLSKLAPLLEEEMDTGLFEPYREAFLRAGTTTISKMTLEAINATFGVQTAAAMKEQV